MVLWPLAVHYLNPSSSQPLPAVEIPDQSSAQNPAQSSPESSPGTAATPSASGTGGQVASGKVPQTSEQAAVPETTNVAERQITVSTPYLSIKLSNKGAVITSMQIAQDPMSDGGMRKINGADGKPLELVPENAGSVLGYPLSLKTPWTPSLANRANSVNYKIDGVPEGQDAIQLNDSERGLITFTYTSGDLTVRKALTFYGRSFVFDAVVDVTSNGSRVPANILIGPRIGDQSDKETGSYSQQPAINAYDNNQSVERVDGAKIAPPFAKISAIDAAAKKITIDKPLAKDSPSVKFVSTDEVTLGYANVISRESNDQVLQLDSIPSGVTTGGRIAQGMDTVRRGYRWAGGVDHYFAMLAVPDQPIDQVLLFDSKLRTDDPTFPVKDYPAVAVPLTSSGGMRIFLGPKDRHLLSEVSSELNTDVEGLINYGMFGFLVKPLAPLIDFALTWGARRLHNYGWSIVLVTILLNLLQSPLRLHSTKKMRSAAKFQPRLKELQEKMKKLKESPKKNEREIEVLQREQMEIMKQANPLGGCLPMLLQMPVFWTLYIYLEVALDVRQQPWVLWIKDLSVADPYKILPIIMCVSMIGSGWLQPMPNSGDPSQKMQRLMTTFGMPVMLTWLFFFSAPSGLVLYWMISNLVGVGIQFVINKQAAPQTAGGPPTPQDEKKAKKAEATRKRKIVEKEVVGGVK
ncbi:MAG TPA: YidC/Oxa1 family insertase periplasmic-domain containing protein [Blastocatellia bacterium]|nr:YidC/Oxa1 family insertase periplasmic-domain containing protein [Blastocatellia bacterium]